MNEKKELTWPEARQIALHGMMADAYEWGLDAERARVLAIVDSYLNETPPRWSTSTLMVLRSAVESGREP
jgi:hypothetical protein